MAEDRTYDVDNLPPDAEVFTGQAKDFEPIDDSEMYQVNVSKVELRDNKFYKPEETDPKKRGDKYQLSFEYSILNEGEFLGRKLWDNASLSLKPTTRQGKPTKLFKIVTKVMNSEFDWDMCQSFAPDIKTLFKNLQENVVGHQALVTIENIKSPETGKVKSKITSYKVIKKELKVPESEEKPQQGTTKEAKDEPDPAPAPTGTQMETAVDPDDIPF